MSPNGMQGSRGRQYGVAWWSASSPSGLSQLSVGSAAKSGRGETGSSGVQAVALHHTDSGHQDRRGWAGRLAIDPPQQVTWSQGDAGIASEARACRQPAGRPHSSIAGAALRRCLRQSAPVGHRRPQLMTYGPDHRQQDLVFTWQALGPQKNAVEWTRMRVRVHLFALLSLVLARLLSSTRAQQQAFTNDLYRVSGSGPSNTTQVKLVADYTCKVTAALCVTVQQLCCRCWSLQGSVRFCHIQGGQTPQHRLTHCWLQMLGALVSAANETYSEADGAQIQLNSYSSCASAPDLMLTTPPPPATPPPPGSIGVPQSSPEGTDWQSAAAGWRLDSVRPSCSWPGPFADQHVQRSTWLSQGLAATWNSCCMPRTHPGRPAAGRHALSPPPSGPVAQSLPRGRHHQHACSHRLLGPHQQLRLLLQLSTLGARCWPWRLPPPQPPSQPQCPRWQPRSAGTSTSPSCWPPASPPARLRPGRLPTCRAPTASRGCSAWMPCLPSRGCRCALYCNCQSKRSPHSSLWLSVAEEWLEPWFPRLWTGHELKQALRTLRPLQADGQRMGSPALSSLQHPECTCLKMPPAPCLFSLPALKDTQAVGPELCCVPCRQCSSPHLISYHFSLQRRMEWPGCCVHMPHKTSCMRACADPAVPNSNTGLPYQLAQLLQQALRWSSSIPLPGIELVWHVVRLPGWRCRPSLSRPWPTSSWQAWSLTPRTQHGPVYRWACHEAEILTTIETTCANCNGQASSCDLSQTL